MQLNEADNLLRIAETALEADNNAEAIELINKALAINPQSSEAWLLKMKAVEDSKEIITYGKKAIEIAEEDVSAEVYGFYLSMILLSNDAITHVMSLPGVGTTSPLAAFEQVSAMIEDLLTDVLVLREAIPEAAINENQKLYSDALIAYKGYTSYVKKMKVWTIALGRYFTDDAVLKYWANLNKLSAGLKDSDKEDLKDVVDKRADMLKAAKAQVGTTPAKTQNSSRTAKTLDAAQNQQQKTKPSAERKHSAFYYVNLVIGALCLFNLVTPDNFMTRAIFGKDFSNVGALILDGVLGTILGISIVIWFFVVYLNKKGL
jgi:tetratricopeptide (TPR) repeat protein